MSAAGQAIPRAQFLAARASGLPRVRLLDALHADTARVVLLTAPAGSGKTTLLAQAATGQGPTAWWHVGAADRSVAAAHRGLGGAVTLALEGAPRAIASRDELLTLLEQAEPGFTLVVDDGHALRGTPAEIELGWFLRLLPPGVRAWVAARVELSAITAPLRLLGQLVELTGEDLRFRSWEVESLFRDCYARRLPPEDIAALTRYTDGWAAGLHMFQLATRDKPLGERRRAVASLLGRSRLLRSYLVSTVMASLRPDVVDFLIRASALVVLRPALCDTLLGRHDSESVLIELVERNLFTMPSDDGWQYRFHSVLQVQLEAMLVERLGAHSARAWYQRAAAILESSGQFTEAYRARAHAEDRLGTGQLLRRHGPELLATSLPRDDDPWLTLADARALCADGQLATAALAYSEAERQFGDPEMQRRCRIEGAAVENWLPAAADGEPSTDDDWAKWLRYALRVGPERLFEHAAGRAEPGWRLAAGLATVLRGRPLEALSILRPVASQRAGAVCLLARLTHATIESLLGRTPVWSLDSVESDAADTALPALAAAARAVRLRAEPAALDALFDDRDSRGDGWGVLLVAVCRVLGAIERGRSADAAALTDLQRRADRLGARFVGDSLVALTRHLGAFDTLRSAAARRPDLIVSCLGKFTVSVDNQPLDCSVLRPRARSVLRLLAMHAGRSVHEETIVAALWPDLPLDSARRNLQVAVSAVRGLLDVECEAERRTLIERRGAAYVLTLPPGSDTDLVTFSRAIGLWRSGRIRRPENRDRSRALLTEALGAYAGDLLAEEGAAEWVVEERQRLRLEAADAAVALAELELADGEADAAAETCRRALHLEPHHDVAYRLLIAVHERTGDLAARARASSAYAGILVDLGVSEQPSTAGEEFHLGDRGGNPLRRASA